MRELTSLQIVGMVALMLAVVLMLVSARFKKRKLAGKLISLALALTGALIVFA